VTIHAPAISPDSIATEHLRHHPAPDVPRYR